MTRYFRLFAGLVALALVFCCTCSASTINFDSSTSTANSTGLPSILATVYPSWATALPGSLWITATGDAAPALNTTVTFTVDLDIAGSFNSATLNLGVYAADTATVMLDGTTLFSENTTLGAHCAAGVIGCVAGNEGLLNNLDVTADVHTGTNTLTFQVFQLVNDSDFGVDFAGSLVTAEVPTPEPSALLLIGSGLVAFAGIIRRKLSR